MKEIFAIIGGLAGIMITFWIFTTKHFSKLIESELQKHSKANGEHLNLVRQTDCRLYEAKVFEKLEEMQEELINLREEFHVFREKIITKLEL